MILIIFVLLFPIFIFVGCNVGPNISEYDEGNDLSFNSNEIKSLHIEMMLSQDDANICNDR